MRKHKIKHKRTSPSSSYDWIQLWHRTVLIIFPFIFQSLVFLQELLHFIHKKYKTITIRLHSMLIDWVGFNVALNTLSHAALCKNNIVSLRQYLYLEDTIHDGILSCILKILFKSILTKRKILFTRYFLYIVYDTPLELHHNHYGYITCLLYTSPSPRD